MYSKQDKDGRITIAASLNPDITGHGSDGKHTTFFTSEGRGFRTRAISETEAGRFALTLFVMIGSCCFMAWLLLSGTDMRGTRESGYPLIMMGVLLFMATMSTGKAAWKESLALFATAGLVSPPFSVANEDTPIALTFMVIVFIGHGVSWKTRAVWEPFVITTLFFALLLANCLGFVPDRLAGLGFVPIAICSFFWMRGIFASSAAYEYGLRNLREY